MKLNFIERLKFLFRKRFHDRYQLTSRGNYLVYYLIRKYINEEEIEEMKTYEESVDECLKKINDMKFFERIQEINPNLPDTPEIRRYFAASLVINMILKSVIPEEKEKILSYITDEECRNNILDIQQNSTWIKFM